MARRDVKGSREVEFPQNFKGKRASVDRTQPGLPMKKGRCGTITHDYKRHGTTSLFAALNILEGTVIGTCYLRHRHQEFLKFLRRVDRETPRGLDLHLILDNYGTHSHPNVEHWFEKHPRFSRHWIPSELAPVSLGLGCLFEDPHQGRRARMPRPTAAGTRGPRPPRTPSVGRARCAR